MKISKIKKEMKEKVLFEQVPLQEEAQKKESPSAAGWEEIVIENAPDNSFFYDAMQYGNIYGSEAEMPVVIKNRTNSNSKIHNARFASWQDARNAIKEYNKKRHGANYALCMDCLMLKEKKSIIEKNLHCSTEGHCDLCGVQDSLLSLVVL